MRLLPLANPLGVLGVPEITLVVRLGQPGPLRLAFAGLAAVRFMAVTLALATPIIGKKKFLAVQALASAARRLHRFQSQKEPVSEGRAKRRKKIQPAENSGQRRRKKSSQRIFRRKAKGRRFPSSLPVLHLFDFTGGSPGSAVRSLRPAAELPRVARPEHRQKDEPTCPQSSRPPERTPAQSLNPQMLQGFGLHFVSRPAIMWSRRPSQPVTGSRWRKPAGGLEEMPPSRRREYTASLRARIP